MTVSVKSLADLSLRFLLVGLLLVLIPGEIQAAELKLEVKLIWCTNDDKSPDPNHKMVDETTATKLRQVFKWKNYFQVNRKTATIPSRSSRQIELSKKCTIEITELQ